MAPYERLIDSGEPIRYGQLSTASREGWLKIASAVAEGSERRPAGVRAGLYCRPVTNQDPWALLAEQRRIPAVNVLQGGGFDNRRYPHRYLLVYHESYKLSYRLDQVTQLLAAVELLEQLGWELMHMFSMDRGTMSHIFCAVVRRR